MRWWLLVSCLTMAACGGGGGGEAAKADVAAIDAGSLADTDATEDVALADAADLDLGKPTDIDVATGAETDAGASTDAPPLDGISQCPVNQPQYNPGGPKCAASLHCEYGKECCCGECSPSYVCDCQNGTSFSCYYSDFCFSPQCSPGCPMSQYKSPAGCVTCPDYQAGLSLALAATLATIDACSQDAECVAMAMPANAFSGCSIALPIEQTLTGSAALAKLLNSWYVGGWSSCYMPCQQAGNPACVQGHCKLVGLCDPSAAPTGSPCEDGDACTTGEVCTGPGICKGQALSCDDANPCTADSCSKTAGCQHAPLDKPCASSVACSLGGVCKSGQCQDGGAKGWQLPLEQLESEQAVARLVDGSFAVAQSAKQEVRIQRVTADGKVLWLAKPGQGHVTSVQGTADGGLVAAGYQFGAVWQDSTVQVWRLDAQGKTVWLASLPLPGAHAVRIAERPEGGFVLTGANTPTISDWHPWLARLDATGKVLGTKDLGPAPDNASLTHVAARTGTMALLTTASGVPGSDGSDLRFVRLDGNGAVVLDKVLAVTQGYDRPTGLVALADGWLGAAAITSYGKADKSSGGWLFRLDDAGQLLWQKTPSTTTIFLLPEATGALAIGLQTVGMVTSPWLVQHLDGAGTLTGDVAIPGGLLGNGYAAAAPGGDGGAVFAVSESAGARLLRVLGPATPCP